MHVGMGITIFFPLDIPTNTIFSYYFGTRKKTTVENKVQDSLKDTIAEIKNIQTLTSKIHLKKIDVVNYLTYTKHYFEHLLYIVYHRIVK